MVLLAACNNGVQPTAGAPQAAVLAPVAPEPIAKGVPHGSQIIEVAVTDAGDAAITFDQVLGVRLWPALDGSRPPIPLTIEAPRHVSIAHSGRDLLVAITTDADSVRVLRLGHDGSIRENVALPDQYKQAIAIDDGVIVRTADHAIEHYGADGALRGRVVADPGKQIATLVSRHGHSAALIMNAQTGTSSVVRWLDTSDGLQWGATIELGANVLGESIAISPSGRRIAFANMTRQLEVWEVDPFKRKLDGNVTNGLADNERIGFLDETHVVSNAQGLPAVRLWTQWNPPAPKPAAYDPWAVEAKPAAAMPQPTEQTHLIDGFAVADGKVITGFGVALAVSSLEKVRYVGYKALPIGQVSLVADQFAMNLGTSHFVWLDDQLAVHRDEEIKAPSSSWMYAIALDDKHVVTETTFEGRYQFELVDLETKQKTSLGNYTDGDRMQYDDASHLFALKEGKKLHRYVFDGKALNPLPDLRISASASSYQLFDPDKANGITAAVVGWDSDSANYETLTIYRKTGKPTRIHPFTGTMTAASPDGTLYAFVNSELAIYRNGEKKPTKLAMPGANLAAVSQDGSRIAYASRDELVVTDATGAAIWRQPQWGTTQLMFSADTSKLLVRGIGGVAIHDAASGVRTAMECGWSFGIYDEPIAGNGAGSEPMCEDRMLQ